jgi:hypothetical protein
MQVAVNAQMQVVVNALNKNTHNNNNNN